MNIRQIVLMFSHDAFVFQKVYLLLHQPKQVSCIQYLSIYLTESTEVGLQLGLDLGMSCLTSWDLADVLPHAVPTHPDTSCPGNICIFREF